MEHLASLPGRSRILSRSHGEKSGEGLVPLLRNDGNMPTQYVANTASDPTVKFA